MGLFDFFKKLVKENKVEEIVMEKLAFSEIEGWIENKIKGNELREKKILFVVGEKIEDFIKELREKLLILELFAKGNVILCDKEMNILRAMRKEQWKDRTLAKEEIYKFPSSRGKNPLEIDEKEFIAGLKENQKSIFGACVELLNVSPTIMESVFDQLKIDKTKSTEKSGVVGKKILKEVKKIYSSKEGTIYLSKGNIYSTKTNEQKEREFENINTALNELLVEEIKPIVVEEIKIRKPKNRTAQYLGQIKEAGKKEIKYKEIGEKIYLEYNTISELFEAIKKGKGKGLKAKEIMTKINSVNPTIKSLDLNKNKIKVEL